MRFEKDFNICAQSTINTTEKGTYLGQNFDIFFYTVIDASIFGFAKEKRKSLGFSKEMSKIVDSRIFET